MKSKRNLQTNFLRFVIEKYNAEIQELPEEETNCSDEKLVDEFDEIMGYGEEKKYKMKTNGSIRNKRK